MKKYSRPQMARHRRIVGMIRQGMQYGIQANASLFMREFAVSRATVMRDLDALRDEEVAPIEYDASRKGFFLSDPGWSLPPLRVSRREVFAFSVAAKLLTAFRGTPLDMDVESLFDKMECLRSSPLALSRTRARTTTRTTGRQIGNASAGSFCRSGGLTSGGRTG